MDFIIEFITNQSFLEVVKKIGLIFILSGIIGLERETWSKPAGFRTHVLLGISSVLLMLCGKYMYETTGADPTRIPAQLLSGIGFLGAGTIMRDGLSVKGLTTAASLLAVTCIGMSVGAGFYMGGIIATIIVFCVLAYSKSISEKFEHHNTIVIQLKLKNIKENLKEIHEILEIYNLEATDIKTVSDDILEIKSNFKEDFNKNRVYYKLMQLKDVEEVIEIEKEAER
ncbi:MAG: MgtC/SapB family protein [Clostridia bacterium]|nr:MgtC/SapB family protein [Clostridia bacterium]